MTADEAIRAGAMALQRNDIRQAVTENGLAEVSLVVNGKRKTLHLDAHAARALYDALDLNLSNRLGKLGVSEL